MKKNWYTPKGSRGFAVIVIISLILTVLSTIACFEVRQIMEDSCLQTLQETAEQGATDARVLLTSGERQVALIAEMLADHTTLDETTCTVYLNSLETDQLLSNYAVLLPDNKLVYSHGTDVTLPETPDFTEESQKDAYFLRRFESGDGAYYTAYVCPIIKRGEVRGILYGFVDLGNLASQFEFSAFDNQCQLYLIDGTNGDFLMDTWHNTLGNAFDGSLGNRKMKLGTSFEQANDDIRNERAGYVAFVSATTGDTFYSCYAPLGIYNLSFQITVDRSTAFADAVRTQRVVYLSCAMQIVILVLFMALFLRRTHQQIRTDQRRLRLNLSVNRMQQMLSGAYRNHYMINDSLQELQTLVGADQTMIIALTHNLVETIYSIPLLNEDAKKRIIGRPLMPAFIADIHAVSDSRKSLVLDAHSHADLDAAADFLGLDNIEIRNLVLSWVQNDQGEIIGVLHAVNVSNTETARDALEQIANGFLLAIQSCETYLLLRNMGTQDSLTGLQNRNAYQHNLRNYETCTPVCCIYIDANGLHEMNNNFGHDAGDEMLRSIADAICAAFDARHSYRIGGDEFVVFSTELDELEVQRRITMLRSRLEAKEYFVSTGYAFGDGTLLLGQVIADAEQNMYADKKAFYAKNDRRGKIREHNRKLENLLLEKRDLDTFLSAISINFFGIYAVNLEKDDTRCILCPPYFTEILEENSYYFRSSMRQYAKEFVASKDFTDFMRLSDYELVQSLLDRDGMIEYTYHRTDGSQTHVRILPSQDYTANSHNVLWIFEKVGVNA